MSARMMIQPSVTRISMPKMRPIRVPITARCPSADDLPDGVRARLHCRVLPCAGAPSQLAGCQPRGREREDDRERGDHDRRLGPELVREELDEAARPRIEVIGPRGEEEPVEDLERR